MSGLDLYFSREYLKAAVLVCLLSVWVLVGLFSYLNLYTRRRYFTIWTAAWLFYALWLTLNFGLHSEETQPWVVMLQQACVGVSAVFLFWGSQQFMGTRVSQRLIGWFFALVLLWSYFGAFQIADSTLMEVPLFGLIGLASLFTARSFFRHRQKHGYIGATLLTVGFSLWGLYMAGYPYLEISQDLISVALFISAAIQLLVAVSMIILVLEEVRTSRQATMEQLHLRKIEAGVLETKVASTEERYRTLFEQAGEAIVITDTKGLRILELNHAAERLLGIAAAEANLHSLGTFCRMPGEQERNGQEMFEAIRKQRTLDVVRKDGASVQTEMDAAPIVFAGKPCYQFFIRELTERARLEQQLRQAEKLSALGQMISGVAHELNNPLAVIKGYLELVLKHHDLPSQTRISLEKVAHESERAAKLVQNFLSFSRKQSSYREPTNPNELIQRVLELRRFNLVIAGVETQIELDPKLPLVLADPDQIEQVLVNLINNAMHAVADKPGSSRVLIRTQQTQHSVTVSVEDNGSGVPAELVTKIFEPFFTTKEVGTGTGLGLSIAHSIMTDHKGKISYHPSSLGGAMFLLEFPIAESASASPQIEKEAAVAAPNGAAAKIRASRSGHILVLDDEESLAEMLAEIVELIGYTSTVSHSPAHALELMAQQRFDLVISDFRMPGMNGQEFYETVKQKLPEFAPRIVFLTGDVGSDETLAFLNSTRNPHLKKPFNLESVERVVTEALDGLAVPS